MKKNMKNYNKPVITVGLVKFNHVSNWLDNMTYLELNSKIILFTNKNRKIILADRILMR